jgi:predicted  nucleic acid-binding Zn-ribbon protein
MTRRHRSTQPPRNFPDITEKHARVLKLARGTPDSNNLDPLSLTKSTAFECAYQNLQEARKARISQQHNVLKLHNRIALLEKEEEKANKRIEDARKQALSMIKSKIEKE